MGTKITELATITDVATNDLLTGVDVSDTSGSANGTNKKFTKASLLSGYALEAYQLSGWNPLGETLVYVSVDDPTGVVKVTGEDVTDKLSVGMRLMFTNGGNVIKAIITAIAFSTDTTITFLHEIDPTDSQALTLMGNSAITLPYFSTQKAPYGFPTDPKKWTIAVRTATATSQANPVSGTWYNLGGSITLPIGAWVGGYQTILNATRASASPAQAYTTLSTTGSTVGDGDLTTYNSCEYLVNPNTLRRYVTVAGYQVVLTVKTTYYLNGSVLGTNHTDLTIGVSGSVNLTIRFTCAYL